MKIALLMAAILLIIGGIVGLLVWLVVKKFDPNKSDKSESGDLSIAQDFLPFEDIRSNAIILPNYSYRAVIECSALNYRLKTEGEREQIELSFQRFINSLSFPISFFLQTKQIDNTERLEELKKDIEKTLIEFPKMQTYADHYVKGMETLSEKIGNNQQKKRYIIVPFDEVGALEQLSDGEKEAYALKELWNRCGSICNGMDAVGVVTHILTDEELVELLYSCYNRDNFSYAGALANKDPFSLFVDGEEDKFHDLPKVGLLDLILGESINQIRTQNLDRDNTGKAVLDQLEAIRMKYAGYFTEEDSGHE